MKLTGIEIRNFRSIGPEGVILSPLSKCNIIIGVNNAGKSNVLKGIKKISDKFNGGNPVSLTELDLHQPSEGQPFMFKLQFEADSLDEKEAKLSKLSGTNTFWFDLTWQQDQAINIADHSFANIKDFHQANALLDHLTGRQQAFLKK